MNGSDCASAEEEEVAVRAYAVMNDLLEVVGDRESHPLVGLLDVVTMFVHDYEQRHASERSMLVK